MLVKFLVLNEASKDAFTRNECRDTNGFLTLKRRKWKVIFYRTKKKKANLSEKKK